MMKNIYFAIAVMSIAFNATAQDITLTKTTKPMRVDDMHKPVDGFYRNRDIENRKVVEYPTLREADVVYRRRIWREIDVREKMNLRFASPKARLIDVIVQAVLAGELTAYDPTATIRNPTGDNFEFMDILSINQVILRLGGDSVLVEEFNADNEVISSHYENRAFNGADVVKFRIKEDWIFDKQRSVFEPRIVGIAPLMVPIIPGLEFVNMEEIVDPFILKEERETIINNTVEVYPSKEREITASLDDPIPIFWIYFPEARHIFVNKEVINNHNMATGLTYDDIFVKRLFNSYIVKQDNLEDLRIKDYIRDDIDRLLEGERIKKKLMDWEQEVWVY